MPDSATGAAPGISKREAVTGIVAGLVLVLAAWFSSGQPTKLVEAHLTRQQADVARQVVPGAAAVLPTPTPTPTPPADCSAPAYQVAQLGFDPYAILAQRRGDVWQFYKGNGWNPASQCVAIYDNWTKNGAGGATPTTPAAYVRAQGWAPAVPVPTPAPPADCVAPAAEVARLGFDPYQVLALHRPDVLNLYQLNGWQPETQCVAIFDDWLKHPDGGPPTSAAAFVVAKGWAKAPPTATPASVAPTVSSRATATAVPTATATVGTTSTSSAGTATTYTVQPGDTLFAIAQREHVSLDALMQANGITNPDLIQAGQVLRIPAATPIP